MVRERSGDAAAEGELEITAASGGDGCRRSETEPRLGLERPAAATDGRYEHGLAGAANETTPFMVNRARF